MELVNTGHIIAVNDKEGRLAARTQIDAYEDAMKTEFGERGIMDEINAKGLTEHIVAGAYIRILDIPAGVTIVSKLWNRERLWIILAGEVIIKSELGSQRVVAPYIAEAPFGSKVAIYAVSDTKWAAITGIKTDDVTKAEEEVEAKDYTEFTYPWELLENRQ